MEEEENIPGLAPMGGGRRRGRPGGAAGGGGAVHHREREFTGDETSDSDGEPGDRVRIARL